MLGILPFFTHIFHIADDVNGPEGFLNGEKNRCNINGEEKPMVILFMQTKE